jgi:hypothetical protein
MTVSGEKTTANFSLCPSCRKRDTFLRKKARGVIVVGSPLYGVLADLTVSFLCDADVSDMDRMWGFLARKHPKFHIKCRCFLRDWWRDGITFCVYSDIVEPFTTQIKDGVIGRAIRSASHGDGVEREYEKKGKLAAP